MELVGKDKIGVVCIPLIETLKQKLSFVYNRDVLFRRKMRIIDSCKCKLRTKRVSILQLVTLNHLRWNAVLHKTALCFLALTHVARDFIAAFLWMMAENSEMVNRV